MGGEGAANCVNSEERGEKKGKKNQQKHRKREPSYLKGEKTLFTPCQMKRGLPPFLLAREKGGGGRGNFFPKRKGHYCFWLPLIFNQGKEKKKGGGGGGGWGGGV